MPDRPLSSTPSTRSMTQNSEAKSEIEQKFLTLHAEYDSLQKAKEENEVKFHEQIMMLTTQLTEEQDIFSNSQKKR
ncbi:MAG: hypothetical protein EZS28_037123, partial [Streblomastix strix]